MAEQRLESVVYRGPAPSRTYHRGSQVVVFEKDVPQEHDAEFVAARLAENPDGLTMEQAAIRADTHIFERVSPPPTAGVASRPEGVK